MLSPNKHGQIDVWEGKEQMCRNQRNIIM